LHPTQSLEGLDHGGQPPGVDVPVQALFETWEAVAVFADGSAIFLQDDVLHCCGTDHLREPPEVGRAPMSPAPVADGVPQPTGFETKLGVFAIADSICTSPAKIADRFLFHLGDIERSEIA
jgi:hypothetical protein